LAEREQEENRHGPPRDRGDRQEGAFLLEARRAQEEVENDSEVSADRAHRRRLTSSSPRPGRAAKPPGPGSSPREAPSPRARPRSMPPPKAISRDRPRTRSRRASARRGRSRTRSGNRS